MSSIALFWCLWPLFLRLKLSRGTIIAANIGQAMVNLMLWLSKSSSLHRQLHGGRGLNSQSLACESHTLPLGYHAILSAITPSSRLSRHASRLSRQTSSNELVFTRLFLSCLVHFIIKICRKFAAKNEIGFCSCLFSEFLNSNHRQSPLKS